MWHSTRVSPTRRTSRACSAVRPAQLPPRTGVGHVGAPRKRGSAAPTLIAFKQRGGEWRTMRRMREKRSLIGLALVSSLACLSTATARQVDSGNAPDPPPRLPVLVPFPECGSTVLLPVRVNGRKPRLFILDSGANSIALDQGFADSIGLRPTGSGAGTGAGAGPVPYRRYPRASVEFAVAGVSFRSDHTISLDLSNQPGILGFSVAGVLGTDFFRLVT